MNEGPAQVYAVAYQHELEEEASIAAEVAPDVSFVSWPSYEELDDITGRQYHSLLRFHRDCYKAAVSIITKPPRSVLDALVPCNGCRIPDKWSGKELTGLAKPKQPTSRPNWWILYKSQAKDMLPARYTYWKHGAFAGVCHGRGDEHVDIGVLRILLEEHGEQARWSHRRAQGPPRQRTFHCEEDRPLKSFGLHAPCPTSVHLRLN